MPGRALNCARPEWARPGGGEWWSRHDRGQTGWLGGGREAGRLNGPGASRLPGSSAPGAPRPAPEPRSTPLRPRLRARPACVRPRPAARHGAGLPIGAGSGAAGRCHSSLPRRAEGRSAGKGWGAPRAARWAGDPEGDREGERAAGQSEFQLRFCHSVLPRTCLCHLEGLPPAEAPTDSE